MRRLKICFAALMIAMLFGMVTCAYAENEIVPYASEDIVSASVAISSNKVITYKLYATSLDTSIKVNYCYLYKKNDDGSWKYMASMTKALPPTCTGTMVETCDASAYITESGTYRVKASFTAGNSTVTRTSNERTFN